MMAWCRLDDTFCDDPKWDALADALGVSPAAAAGSVALLYSWAVRHAPDGVLTNMTARGLARVCRHDGDPKSLYVALLSHDILREGEVLEINGYSKRSESFMRAKQKQKERASLRQSHDSRTTVAKMSSTERRREEKRRDNTGEIAREARSPLESDFSETESNEVRATNPQLPPPPIALRNLIWADLQRMREAKRGIPPLPRPPLSEVRAVDEIARTFGTKYQPVLEAFLDDDRDYYARTRWTASALARDLTVHADTAKRRDAPVKHVSRPYAGMAAYQKPQIAESGAENA